MTLRQAEAGVPRFLRIPKGVRRHPAFLFGLISLLAVALLLTILPKAVSRADVETSGFTWKPGQLSVEKTPYGQCYGVVEGLVDTDDERLATILAATFRTLAPYDDGEPDGFGKQTIEKTSLDTTEDTVAIESKLAVDCAIAVDDGGSEHKGRELLPVPRFTNGGLSSLGGNLMYVIVGATVVTALSLAVGSATVEQGIFNGIAGCLGGAAMTSTTHLLSGAAPGWKGGLVSGAAGCVSGAAFALLPVKVIGMKIADAIRPWISRPVAAVVGTELVAAAEQAGSGATPLVNGIPEVFGAIAKGAESAI